MTFRLVFIPSLFLLPEGEGGRGPDEGVAIV